MHFTPPLVLPAHDPNTMHTVSTTHVMWGQSPASVLKSPVVEMKDDTWNSAFLNESAAGTPLFIVKTQAMNTVESDITVR